MDEHRPGETRTQQLRPKEKIARLPDIPEASWREQLRRKPGEELLKNMAVAAALVMCAITLRGGALPQAMDVTDAVMTAVTGDTLLDDQLGKLSFVSALFPEATLVFGQTSPGEALAMPVSGGAVVHAWSEDEPYMAWRTGSAQITSSMDGEVIGVYHGFPYRSGTARSARSADRQEIPVLGAGSGAAHCDGCGSGDFARGIRCGSDGSGIVCGRAGWTDAGAWDFALSEEVKCGVAITCF